MSADNYSGKFRLYRRDDWTKLPAMRWQIQNLVPLHGVTLLFGPAKVGKKSFVSISMACAVATEKDWCGYPTRKGKVLYVVPEDFYGILRRQEAWEITHSCKAGDNLRYLRVPVNFADKDDVKAALEALTRGHAAELGPKKVTVNAVAPGVTDTEMSRAALPAEVKQHMIHNTALGRLGTPEDIADVVAFLASDDARWITGQFIDANGGLRF